MTPRDEQKIRIEAQILQVEEQFMQYRYELKRLKDWFRRALGFNILSVLLFGYSFFKADEVLIMVITSSESFGTKATAFFLLILFIVAVYFAYRRFAAGIWLTIILGFLMTLMLFAKGYWVASLITLCEIFAVGIISLRKAKVLKKYESYDGYPFQSARAYVMGKTDYFTDSYIPPEERPCAFKTLDPSARNAEDLSASPEKAAKSWDDDILPPVTLDEDEIIGDKDLHPEQDVSKHTGYLMEDYMGG